VQCSEARPTVSHAGARCEAFGDADRIELVKCVTELADGAGYTAEAIAKRMQKPAGPMMTDIDRKSPLEL
jgi:hypothetical protein